MFVVSAGSANELFAQACRAVLAEGRTVAPRGATTRELLGAYLCLTDPRRRLVDLPPTRVINPAFAAAEAVWILSGSDAPWIRTYNAQLAEYSDHGAFPGAYGPRLRSWNGREDQLDYVRRVLRADPVSRRAVVQLFDPGRDRPEHTDVPCTLGYRFYVRDGRLEMHTTMRSQDLWLGFCYDIFTATLLQELLADWLGVELGAYHHHVDSLHLYERHQAAATSLPSAVFGEAMHALAAPFEDFDALLGRVIGGGEVTEPGWAEVAAVMRSYRHRKDGEHETARGVACGTNGVLAAALRRWYDRLDRTNARSHTLTDATSGALQTAR